MDNPKISVIISIYNGEKDLHIMLDSLAGQPFEDIEYILIDNGSTDNTRQVCQCYAEKDSRFRIEIIEQNIGYIAARNFGITKAKGKYITFADADDYLCENAYGIMYDAVSKADADMLIAPYNLVHSDGTIEFMPLNFESGTYNKARIKEQLLPSFFGYNRDNIIIHGFMWRMLFRRSVVDSTQNIFFEEAKPQEDQLFNQVHVLNCNSIEIIDYPVYNYVVNQDSVTAKLNTDYDYKDAWTKSLFVLNRSLENAKSAGVLQLVEYSVNKNLYNSIYAISISTSKSISFGDIGKVASDFKVMFDKSIIDSMYKLIDEHPTGIFDKLLKNQRFGLLLFSIKAMQKICRRN